MTSARRTAGLELAQLAAALGARLDGEGTVRVTGVHHDSRRVEPGDLFVARQGEQSDGLRFVPQAASRGAVAILAQRDHAPAAPALPMLLVDDIRVAIGRAAALVYGDPTEKLHVIGITGTNGKTTTSYLVRGALDGAGQRTGVLGTLGASFEDLRFPPLHTTPEADEVARVAAAMRGHGATHLVMEVSSHALDQRRADAVHFKVAAFTNLTRDHLDYHHTIDAYAAAKARLFFELSPAAAVIMVDDPFGEQLAQRASMPVIRVSRDFTSRADVRPAQPPELDLRGLRCPVHTPAGEVLLDAPFVGDHNLANLLLTLGIATALGVPVDRAAAALAKSPAVPGRLERCDTSDDDVLVLVDYAHTPDALERALRAIRPLTAGQVHCVFGCGGDRDRTKRPVMGQVVGDLADVAVLTNDNPRSEAPEAIAASALEGLEGRRARATTELDRARAIDVAVLGASPGDVVLIAGKGHEPYQIVGAETRHFDDREEARRALAARRAATRQKES